MAHGTAMKQAIARSIRRRRLLRLQKRTRQIQWRSTGMFSVVKDMPAEDRDLIDRWLEEHRG
jgi:hypothetical protein